MKRNQRAPRANPLNGFGRWWIGCGLFTAVIALAGCSYLRPPSSQPKAQVKSLQLSTNGANRVVTVRSLQLEVMRFADNYAAVVAHAADDFNTRAVGPEARRAATKWKLDHATAAYIDASGPNPVINALDIVVLASASRMVMEDNLTAPPFGEAALPLLESHRLLETNAWALVNTFLKPEQQKELLEIIQEWRRNNPQQRDVAGLRFREFMSAFSRTQERASSSPTSLFGLLFLDPMASMDPTTSAIEETRNTGERAIYYAQRMPTLLNWQVELLTYELVVQPETKQILGDTARFSKASEAFAKAAADLPGVIAREREAAIKQALEGLAQEEKKAKELFGEARVLATEARETLKAGSAAAESISTTIKTLDEFVRSVTQTNDAPSNQRPFDVLDYATTARDISSAAKDLQALLGAANSNVSQLSQLRQESAAEVRNIVDYSFSRAITLILVFFGGALVTATLYRVVANRLNARRTPAEGH